MKAVTCSIALVSLVALGCLVSPCFSTESPYMKLNQYIIDSKFPDTLEGNIAAAGQLITDSLSLPISEDVVSLARHLQSMEGPGSFCSYRKIDSLYELTKAGADSSEDFTSFRETATRLTSLLRNTVQFLLTIECYKTIRNHWAADDKSEQKFASIANTRAIEYLNREHSFDGMFRRLIYRPISTPPATDAADNGQFVEKIKDLLFDIDDNLLVRSLRSRRVKEFDVSIFLQRNVGEHCDKLISSTIAKQILKPASQLLAMQMIVFPNEPQLPYTQQSEHNIDFLPAYVMCDEIEANKLDSSFIRRLFVRIKHTVMETRP